MGSVINDAGDQMYLYEVTKDTVFCLSYGETNLYSWNYQNNNWAKIDSFWYHELGVGDKMGLSMIENRKKIYFAKLFAYKHIDGKPFYNIDIFVTYWDSVKNYWGNVYSLNINTEPTFTLDSSRTYGGGEYDPWISPNGKVLIFASNRGAVYDSINIDNSTDIYISYLLVDENGDPVSIMDESPINQVNKNYKISNFPNPFNSSTTISYALPQISDVEIVIYDITGREVKRFVIPSQSGGYQNIVWDGKNEFGISVSSGIYIYRFRANSLEDKNQSFEKTAKFMLLK